MPLLYPASPSSRTPAAKSVSFNQGGSFLGQGQELETFQVKLDSVLHDHQEYTYIARGKSCPELEAAVTTLLGLAHEDQAGMLSSSLPAREVLASALFSDAPALTESAVSLVPSVLCNGDISTGIPTDRDVVGRLIEILQQAQDLRLQDLCCAALSALVNAAPLKAAEEAEGNCSKAQLTIQRRIIQANGVHTLLTILERKKQSEKQRYADAWDLESCQAHAANILTALAENGLLTDEQLDLIVHRQIINRLLDLAKSEHVEGDGQRAALRCLIALCTGNARVCKQVRTSGGEATAKRVLNHPAGNRQQTAESQRLAGALIAVLLESRNGGSNAASPTSASERSAFRDSVGSSISEASLRCSISGETPDTKSVSSASDQPLEGLGVKQLKDLLSAAGISCKGCVERSDLINLATRYGVGSDVTSPSSVSTERVLNRAVKRGSVASPQSEDLTDEIAANVGDCLAALIQSMLRDGDTQSDSAAMAALGRLSKLGMALRDGNATPMAAAFAEPLTKASLLRAIRECGLAQLLACASAEQRACVAHSGLLQAACHALKGSEESSWAPASDVLAELTQDTSLASSVIDHGGLLPIVRHLLSFDPDGATKQGISPLVVASLRLLANLVEEAKADELPEEERKLERMKRQRVMALVVKQGYLSTVDSALATTSCKEHAKGSPTRHVSLHAMRLLYSVQQQEAFRTKVARLPSLGHSLAFIVEDRGSAAAEMAAACRLLADLSLVRGFCEGFRNELADVVSRLASRLEKRADNEVDVVELALLRLVCHLKSSGLDFWASEFTWRAVCAAVKKSPAETCKTALAAGQHLFAQRMVELDKLATEFWPAVLQRVSSATKHPDEASLLNALLLFVANAVSASNTRKDTELPKDELSPDPGLSSDSRSCSEDESPSPVSSEQSVEAHPGKAGKHTQNNSNRDSAANKNGGLERDSERDNELGCGPHVVWKVSRAEQEQLILGLLSSGLSAAIVPLFFSPAALPALSVVGSLGVDTQGSDKLVGTILRDKLLLPELARLVILEEATDAVLSLARLALKQLFFANPVCHADSSHAGEARLAVRTKADAPPDYFAYSHHSGCIVVAPEMSDRAMAALRKVVAAKPVDRLLTAETAETKGLRSPPKAAAPVNCIWCGTEVVDCVRCTHCRAGPRYCSDTCRHNAWPSHEEDCPKDVKGK